MFAKIQLLKFMIPHTLTPLVVSRSRKVGALYHVKIVALGPNTDFIYWQIKVILFCKG